MSPDRVAVVKKVLAGELSAEALTMEELDRIGEVVMELIEEKIDTKIEEAVAQGKIVFSGIENGYLQ